MGKYCLILFVGIVESEFKGPFLSQVSLFHQPHPLLSHMHNPGIISNTNLVFWGVFFAQMISSWICSMNYLHWNVVVHVLTPANFFDLKMILFFCCCFCLERLLVPRQRCWRRLRLIHARERAGWVTPTQSALLNGERDTAPLWASAALLYIPADDTKLRPIQMSEWMGARRGSLEVKLVGGWIRLMYSYSEPHSC